MPVIAKYVGYAIAGYLGIGFLLALFLTVLVDGMDLGAFFIVVFQWPGWLWLLLVMLLGV